MENPIVQLVAPFEEKRFGVHVPIMGKVLTY